MKAYASFLDWKKDQSAKNQKLIRALERLVKKIAPGLTTTVKWGQGCWIKGVVPKIYIHAEDTHVQFGFYNGASLKDSDKVLNGKGKYVRHIKVNSLKDIDQEVFTDFIQQAIT
jgi:hypothetical protein